MSLPAWECGLKYFSKYGIAAQITSLPAWECGLKYTNYPQSCGNSLSLPAWECGLKWCCVVTSMNQTGHSLRGSVD